jgi:hypothetical protein
VSFTVCVALGALLFESCVIFCVLCLIAVPLPPGENTFAVQFNNNNNNNNIKGK